MKLYTLVGKSGTGKSYLAGEVCRQYGIDGIVDDGLFIYEGSILAGKSAKRQGTKIGAVKTALFSDPEHRTQVREQIRETRPASLLVIGTSDKMVTQIAEALGLYELLGPFDVPVRLDIEKFTTEEQRSLAHKHRYEMGEHVIPAPAIEIKKAFSGYLIHPVRSVRGMADGFRAFGGLNLLRNRAVPGWENPSRQSSERSVVRPSYSYLGRFSISDHAVADIVRIAASRCEGIPAVGTVFVQSKREGAVIDISVSLEYGIGIGEAVSRFQALVEKDIESMTALNVISVNVDVEKLV
jgi:uncharacterized alkaline shock family protein YloU